jgi:hypothetical protein
MMFYTFALLIKSIFQHWTDEKIHWKPEDYGGLTSIHITEHEVWIPEIVLYKYVCMKMYY